MSAESITRPATETAATGGPVGGTSFASGIGMSSHSSSSIWASEREGRGTLIRRLSEIEAVELKEAWDAERAAKRQRVEVDSDEDEGMFPVPQPDFDLGDDSEDEEGLFPDLLYEEEPNFEDSDAETLVYDSDGEETVIGDFNEGISYLFMSPWDVAEMLTNIGVTWDDYAPQYDEDAAAAAGLAPVLHPTGDVEADIAAAMAGLPAWAAMPLPEAHDENEAAAEVAAIEDGVPTPDCGSDFDFLRPDNERYHPQLDSGNETFVAENKDDEGDSGFGPGASDADDEHNDTEEDGESEEELQPRGLAQQSRTFFRLRLRPAGTAVDEPPTSVV